MEAPVVAEFLGGLVRSSWQEAVLAGVVWWIVWLMGNRLEARWRIRLWILVLLRLAWPFFLPSPLSLFNWLGTAFGPDPGGEAGVEDPGQTLPFVLEQEGVQTLWLVGAAMMVLGVVVSLLGVRRLRRSAWDIHSRRAQEILSQCCREMGVCGRVRLVESDRVSGPCLIGVLRPSIVMPEGLVEDLSDQQLRFVFRHELAHLMRWDLPFNWLLLGVRTIHWFNPLAWYVARRILEDREEICDAIAVDGRSEACRPYGELLLQLAERRGSRAWLGRSAAGCVGMMGLGSASSRVLGRRLKALRRVARGGRTTGVGFLLWMMLLLAGFTDAVPRPSEEAHRPGQLGWQQILPPGIPDGHEKTLGMSPRGL